MKIVCTNHPDNAIFQGIAAALTTVNKETFVWDAEKKSTYDMFDEIQPDILICTTQDIAFISSIAKAVQEFPTKLIIFGVGSYQANADLLCIPPNIPAEILNNVDGKWIQTKIAANAAQFNNGKYDKDYESDILFISNIQPANNTRLALTLDYISSLQHRVKIVGKYAIDLPTYLGRISIMETTLFIKSAKIVIDFDENIMWDCALNKTFCLSNKENELYPHYIIKEELNSLLNHHLSEKKHCDSISKKAYKMSLANTYYHQAKEICDTLELTELSAGLEDKINE